MSVIRLPLLCAFAGGCLSSAVLLGLWQTADGSSAPPAKQQQRPRVVQRMTATTRATSTPASSEVVDEAMANGSHPTAPAATPTTQDLDGTGPTPAGSAVADVLMQLEAAYRERVTAQAPTQASATSAAAPALSATAALAPTPGALPVAEVVAAVPVVTTLAAISGRLVAPAQPAAAAPVAVAIAPQVSAAPVVVAQYTPPPTQVHYGDVNQNTYITNVRQGDMYQMQMQMQMQQIAMLQYIQLLGMSSAVAGPARNVGVAAPQRGTLNTGITNPDNPWGFHFSPLNLVR